MKISISKTPLSIAKVKMPTTPKFGLKIPRITGIANPLKFNRVK